MRLNRALAITHFGLIVLLILNGVLLEYTGTGLNMMLVFVLKIVFYLAGATLFFKYARPFKKRAIYYGFYVFYLLLCLAGWMIDGIFGAILLSFFFAIFWMPDIVKKTDDHVLIQPFGGFFNSHVRYEIRQNKYLLLQKHRGELKLDGETSIGKATFRIVDDTAYLGPVRVDVYPERGVNYETDTTVTVGLK